MDFLTLARQRCSVRDFEPTPVENEKLLQMLEAGRVAPTAANRQPQHFLVINDESGFERLRSVGFHTSAPLVIIVCGDHNSALVRGDNKTFLDADVSIATDHIMLAAEALGLSSCWLGWFDPAEMRKAFDVPAHVEPMSILIIGYGKEKKSADRHSTDRKPLDEFVHYNVF